MICLSYPLSLNDPAYGGGPAIQIQANKQIINGDSCNTFDLKLSNHSGTHIDCPYHFDPHGKKISDYPADFWFSDQVQVLSVNLEPKELVTPDLLEKAWMQVFKKNDQAQAVFLVTGWAAKRGTPEYIQTPPGFEPQVATWLRQRFRSIRFFGFDLISLSSFFYRDVGRLAHKSFLCHAHPILVIEDLNLCGMETTPLHNVLISPLIVEGLDSGPCTVWANIHSKERSSL